MKLTGFPLMRIGGIAVIIDYSWLVMFFIILVFTQGFFEQTYPGYSAPFHWMMGGIASILIFLSVLIHELAHSFVAMKYGIKITTIRLHIFGGLSHVAPEPQSGRQEFIIALAGWAVSMALGCFFLVVCAYFMLMQQETPVMGVAACLMIANGILAALHMIPGFPLDGGRVLRAILWDRWNDMARATRVVSQVGNAFALFLIIFGILQFLVTQSLVSGLLFVIGLFMKQSATGNYQFIIQGQALEGVLVRQVMTEKIVTVDWLLPVEALVENYIHKYPFKSFPVFNRDEFIGMVSNDGVESVARDLWTFKQVRDIMVPIESIACVRPADNASEVLKKMVSDNTGCMPVLDGGKMVGVVSRSDIMNPSRTKSDLGTA